MRVLEQFMIALGIKVDEKSFQKADAAFGGLTKSALSFGAVLAGKLAIDKVVGDFKNLGTQLDNFHKLTGFNTQNVQALGQAFTAMGGSADEALGTFQKVQDLMNSKLTGKVEWAGEAAKFGFNSESILNAKSAEEALAGIAGELEKLPPLQRRLAAHALGFSDNETRVLIDGRKELEKLMDAEGKLAIMTGKQIEDAAHLTKANSELDQVFTDMGTRIAGDLTPGLIRMEEGMTELYRSNQKVIDQGIDTFFKKVSDNIEVLTAALLLLGGAGALKGLATLGRLVGLGAARAGAGAAGGTAGVAGRSLLVNPLTVGVAAAAYSSSLNDGEDDELLKNRMKQGGSQAAGPVIDYLRAKGIPEVLATGIAARIQKESQFNAQAVGDGGKAYGLLQWHPDRQADFKSQFGKDIKTSNETEQMDFIVHEITKGKERANWDKVKDSQTPYEAGSKFSRFVVRPGVTEEAKEREARETGELAESYGRSAPASTAPEVSAEELFRLSRGYNTQKESLLDQTKTFLDAHRKASEKQPAYDTPEEWKPLQREAPREYSATSVLQPSSSAGAVKGSPPAPSYTDQRQYHIHGADTEKVKQVLNEQMSGLINQTSRDFKGPER